MASIFQDTLYSKLKDRVRSSPLIRVVRPTRELWWRCQDFALDRMASTGPSLSRQLLVATIPKAGLHLLGEVLQSLPELNRRPLPLPNNHPVEEHCRSFEKLARNRFAHWHYGANDETLAMAAAHDSSVVVLIRDPRDILVSFVDYVSRLKFHVLHRHYIELPDKRDRLKAAIRGAQAEWIEGDLEVRRIGRNNPTYPGIGNIGEVCRAYLNWKKHARVHFVRYEDLVGSKGGGSDERQEHAVRDLINFLGVEMSSGQISGISARIYNPSSTTFNKGITGRWKEHFDSEAKSLFKQVANPELVDMGYERDDSW